MISFNGKAEAFTPAPTNGLTNPTLAFNPSGVSDWGTNMPFIDLMDTARAWIGHLPNKWGGMTTAELQAGGYLDDNGWVKKIPEGLTKVGTIWAWGDANAVADRKGVYVLTYEGEGTIKLGLDAKVLSSEPGRIVFENTNGSSFAMDITATDPGGTGNYIRDISIVAEEDQALHEAGAIFNPDWLALIDDARVLRFMDWGATNNSTVTAGDMPLLEAEGFWQAEGQGVPVEYMVALANQTGADPWFCIPHGADEAYIRAYATYVRDHLDPNLTAHVEYSNEVWNWSFQQTKWLAAQALAEWGVGDAAGYHVKKAAETALIWQDVFGSEADARLENVLATQTVNTSLTQQLLSGGRWRSMEPDAWTDPATVFDKLAVTTYFGNFTASNADLRAELIAQINDPAVDAAAWLAERLMDPEYAGSIPQIAGYLRAQADLAHEFGLDLVAYEGGQHVHHSFAVKGLTEAEITALTDFMIDFVRSEEMAQLYEALWAVWSEIGDGPFMQFGDVGAASARASFSLYDSLGDHNPRADLLEELNATSTPWWDGAEGGEHYQQGLILEGTAGADLLTGTQRIDYLIGGDGDDIFVAGEGNDGINGGEGTDRLVLSGRASDYRIVADGAGYRLTGPDGSKFVIHVEFFRFDDRLVTLEDLLAGLPAEDQGLPEDPSDPDPGEVEGGGGDQPGPVTPTVAPVGQRLAAADLATVTVDDEGSSGVTISAINRWSALGRELGLQTADPRASYLVHENDAALTLGDRVVRASYWSLQDNRDGEGGVLLSDSAVGTALRMASIVTRAGEITATAGNDRFYGREQADTVHGGAGNDYLGGGAGDDVLYGDAGNDTIRGGGGDDLISGGSGHDVLNGDDGDDIIRASGTATVDGGAGHDRLVLTGAAEDYLLIAEGNGYRLTGAGGSGFLTGIEELAFDDRRIDLDAMLALSAAQLRGLPSGAVDLAALGAHLEATDLGEVRIASDTGVVIGGINIWSALGRDLGLCGTDGAGSYTVNLRGAEALFDGQTVGASYWSLQDNRATQGGALLGEDALGTALSLASVVTHASAIIATAGHDTFIGREFADVVRGEAGNDYLAGGAGHDRLHGGAGRDTLLGGAGDDLLEGGAGHDILRGDAGCDTFVFSAGCESDRVEGFGEEDLLDLGDFLAAGQTLGDVAGLDADGNLTLSNGSDLITFQGLDLDDLHLLQPIMA